MGRRCPVCDEAIDASTVAFPFCSARCRSVDLGNWLDEHYTLPDPAGEELSSMPVHSGGED